MTAHDRLFQALTDRRFADAEAILGEGVDLNRADGAGKSSLFHQFLLAGQIEQARWLAAHGADVNAVDLRGDTVLLSLIERNRRVEFKAAMDLGVDVNRANDRGVAPILRAALFRHGLPYLQDLLAAGANPSVVSNNRTTPLMAAVAEGFEEMAVALFDAGASPLGLDEHGQSIFFSAVLSGKPRMLKLVLDRTEALRAAGQMDVNYAAGGSKPIAKAAAFSPEMVLLLMRAGGDVNAQSKNRVEQGLSPLMLLCASDNDGEAEWVKEALAAGARPNLRDHQGNNAVLYAVASGLDGKRAVLEALLAAGLDPKAPISASAASPLHVALNYTQPFDETGELVGPSRKQVIETLLGMGFPSLPLAWQPPSGEKPPHLPAPLIVALGRRDMESARAIVAHGAPLSELDGAGESVLHRMAVVTGLNAAERQAVDMTRALMERKNPKEQEAAAKAAAGGPADSAAPAPAPKPASKKKMEMELELALIEAEGREVVAEAADLLSRHGADWNLRSADGLTPAMALARDDGHLILGQVVRFHGADLSLTDPQGWTAADHAMASGADQALQAILGHLQATEVGMAPVAGLILNAVYASPEIDHDDAETFHAREAFIARLRSLPADPLLLEHRDEQGNTPLIVAAATGQDDVVRALLALGADPNAQNAQGETAVIQAVWEKQPDIVRLLRAAGANLSLRSANGTSPLEMAQSRDTLVAAALRDPDPSVDIEPIERSDAQQNALEKARDAWGTLQPAAPSEGAAAAPRRFLR